MGLFDGLLVSPDKGYLREDLSQIDESWVAARFDSLPHVVHILTSKDREGEVRFLKEQSDIVEEVVDEVVHAYHSGFNKAIQNYSQILRLFSESTESIAVLKDDLADAKRRLSARNKQLHQLWCRYVTLRHIISLLDQIEGIAKVCLFVIMTFFAALEAEVGTTFAPLRMGLPAFITNGERGIFHGIIIFFSSSINENDDEVPTTTVVALSMNNSQPLSRRTRLLKGDNQFGVHGDGLYRPSSIDGGSSFDGHDEDGALDAHDEVRVNGGEGYSKEVKIVPRQMPTWLLYSTPNEFLINISGLFFNYETMQKSDAPLHVKYLQTMVECLCMLGKVAAAGAMICQRLRPTIHEVITSKIKAHAKLVNSSRYGVGQTTRSVIPGLQFMEGHLESYQLPKQKRQNGISLAGTLLAVSPVSHVMAPTGKAQAAAKELLDSILDTVRIFDLNRNSPCECSKNHVVVGEILELKSAPSDMNTPKSMSIDGNWNLDSEASQVTGGYSIGFSLTVLQTECQQLICEILRATPEAAFADAAVQTARLASKVPSKGKRDGAEDGLTFAFHFTDGSISIPNQGVDLIRQGWSKKGPIIQEGYESATLLPSKAYILQHPYTGMFFRFMIFSFHACDIDYKVASMLPMKYSQLGNDGLLAFMLTLEKGLLTFWSSSRVHLIKVLAGFREKIYQILQSCNIKFPDEQLDVIFFNFLPDCFKNLINAIEYRRYTLTKEIVINAIRAHDMKAKMRERSNGEGLNLLEQENIFFDQVLRDKYIVFPCGEASKVTMQNPISLYAFKKSTFAEFPLSMIIRLVKQLFFCYSVRDSTYFRTTTNYVDYSICHWWYWWSVGKSAYELTELFIIGTGIPGILWIRSSISLSQQKNERDNLDTEVVPAKVTPMPKLRRKTSLELGFFSSFKHATTFFEVTLPSQGIPTNLGFNE
ncbi:hypothetical protein UlMin_036782 [Ulmus minor]